MLQYLVPSIGNTLDLSCTFFWKTVFEISFLDEINLESYSINEIKVTSQILQSFHYLQIVFFTFSVSKSKARDLLMSIIALCHMALSENNDHLRFRIDTLSVFLFKSFKSSEYYISISVVWFQNTPWLVFDLEGRHFKILVINFPAYIGIRTWGAWCINNWKTLPKWM